MSARYDRFGRRIPVTRIAAVPNIVLAVKDNKAQLGFGQKKKAKKTESAFVKVASYAPRLIKEVSLADPDASSVGSQVTVSAFEVGDLVKVSGITRGRGFAGVVKRWGFAGGPKTHGQSDRHRAPGSIGQTTTPGRVYKGKRMAGHLGAARKTVRNLEVIEVERANNLLVVKGAVPGARNGLLVIEKTGKAKDYTPPPQPKAIEDKEEKWEQEEETRPKKEEMKDQKYLNKPQESTNPKNEGDKKDGAKS